MSVKAGDVVTLSKDAVYYGGDVIPNPLKEYHWHVNRIMDDKVILSHLSMISHCNIIIYVESKYLQKTK